MRAIRRPERPRSLVVIGTALAAGLLAWSPPAFALNPALDVSQYSHTSWKRRDGFSNATIVSFAQTADGYLWLGTEAGLLRFDGVRFVPWSPPPGASLPGQYIRSLLGARDGTLWIGTLDGLASLKDGTLTQYAELAGHSIDSILEDGRGTVWTAGARRDPRSGRLCAIRNGGPTCDGVDGRFGQWVYSLLEDSRGYLWAVTSTGLWRWMPGEPQFYPLMEAASGALQVLASAGDGALLLATRAGVRRFTEGKAALLPHELLSPESGSSVLRDRDGGVWIGRLDGLVHVHQGRSDTFLRSDGLSGDGVSRMFEDREGNIWVATSGGVDRFREAAAATFSSNQGLSSSVVGAVLAASDGGTWFSTSTGLNRWRDRQLTAYHGPREPADQRPRSDLTSATVRERWGSGVPAGVGSLYQDSRGRLIVAAVGRIGYMTGERFVPIEAPVSLVNDMTEDIRGNLWIADLDRGLIRVAADRTVQQIPISSLGRSDFITRLAADPQREDLWVGFAEGGVLRYTDGRVSASYGVANGLGQGRVKYLQADRDGTLWVATSGGLSRVKNGHAATLSSKSGLPCDLVDWMIDDGAGSVWLSMGCGLARVARSDLEAWATAVDQNPQATLTIRASVLDSADGVRGSTDVSTYSPHATRSADGRLWFATTDGANVVDPRRLPFNDLPPPVHVEQVIADRKSYAVPSGADGSLALPALIRDLQIDYTAPSFVAPEKVVFRYRLEGRDGDWQEAGTRRQAFYTDLAPGNYRFRVIAANNSGVWNEAGAALDFSVAPAYYQTNWFAALSVAAIAALLWSAHRVRLRIVERHQREISALNERLMKAQEQERIRIAGELHDGVMQKMLAVTMMLGTTKRRASDSETKASLDKIQEKLIQTGTDIRQLSHGLHPPALQEAGLPQAVQAYCEEFSQTCGIPVVCEAAADASELSRGASLALFRILQEALGNAAKHAHATRIAVGLTRADGTVSLTVSDDGAGFDASRLGTAGGLGLIMMRERATQLNGKFEFQSAPGHGTTIRVVIPFR
jgi:signal transduction histidine kinase/ligand-binding sensor domain-containing protein